MKIIKLKGEIELITGLHIGGGDDTMKIGGIDNGVVKDINTNKPYIPGSSLKGKMRSLLEWDCGVVGIGDGNPFTSKVLKQNNFPQDKELKEKAINLLKIFGDKEGEFGITRISIGDCKLVEKENQKVSEAKYENVINRQNGTAEHPRQTERVPAGVKFEYDIRLKVLSEDNEEELKNMIKRGMELIENDYLGGNGSRGYGRVNFSNKDKWIE